MLTLAICFVHFMLNLNYTKYDNYKKILCCFINLLKFTYLFYKKGKKKINKQNKTINK